MDGSIRSFFIVFIFYFFTLNSYCQESIVLSYKVMVSQLDNDNLSHKPFNTAITKSKSTLDRLIFELKSNGNESKFQMKKMLFSDGDQNFSKMALAIVRGQDIYYANIVKDTSIVQKNIAGDKINVVGQLFDINWELIDEQREIMGYICYKATASLIKETGKGEELVEKVEAWYAPKVPINVGPRNYMGLPGLILYLQEGMVSFECVQYEMKDFSIQIEAPESEIIMSNNDYEQYLKRKSMELFKN